MDDLNGLLHRDYGLKPHGKAAPMGVTKNSGFAPKSSPPNDIFSSNDFASSHSSSKPATFSSPGHDTIFNDFPISGSRFSSTSAAYDAPVYDDDIFGGVSGLRSVSHDDFFGSNASSTTPAPASFDDLLGEMGSSKSQPPTSEPASVNPAFADLIPGFGSSESNEKARSANDEKVPAGHHSARKPDDPFVVLDGDSFSSNASSTFHDPLEDFVIPLNSGRSETKTSSAGAAINDIFDGFPAAAPVSSTVDTGRVETSSPGTSQPLSPKTSGLGESVQENIDNDFGINSRESYTADYSGHYVRDFDRSVEMEENVVKSFPNKEAQPLNNDIPSVGDQGPQGVASGSKSDRVIDSVANRWITIDEVILVTQPTVAPPPRRPPPPLYVKHGQPMKKKMELDNDSPFSVNSFDKHEEFSVSGSHFPSNEEENEDHSTAAASRAAAMEAMEKAEAKLKQVREAREREKEERERESRILKAKLAERKEREERAAREAREREEREKAKERERERERVAVERATKEARERAAAEAREKAQRTAVERATREARERAAAEARQRAAASEAREKAEKEAAEARRAERAAAEARQRQERVAVERIAAEARQRAAAEAREKMERMAAERAAAEARMRFDRAAVEKAHAEARKRAEAAARESQRQSENDLESFFCNIGSQGGSVPKQRPTTSDSAFDELFQSKGFPSSEGPRRTTPQATSEGMRKAASSTTAIDDFASLFNTTSSSDVFQEVEGESEERRRARWERYQRTRERAAKALAEKNQRDLQAQREQAERHRLAETLDAEIKRWAAGKEGNLRALLSTLQYILWPEAGWQPVSLTDVITAASVKKVYRKATLCVHPDKVQQKGATLQQKYIAEKVFDLLKEAWNKFNSEELF